MNSEAFHVYPSLFLGTSLSLSRAHFLSKCCCSFRPVPILRFLFCFFVLFTVRHGIVPVLHIVLVQ